MAFEDAVLDIACLVKEHHAAVYRYAYRLTGRVTDAEDLAQQVFLIAQQKLSQLRETQHARSWLLTIVRNCYLKEHRRPLPVPVSTLDFNIDNVAEEVTNLEIDKEQLQAALDDLPSEFKVVLLMFYFEERAYREIAEILDMPVGTVMSRLSRAKSHLRGRLFERSAKETAPMAGASAKSPRVQPRDRTAITR